MGLFWSERSNVLIVGAGEAGAALLKLLLRSKNINVAGITDRDKNAPGIKLALEKGIPVFSDHRSFLKDKNADKIINTIHSADIADDLLRTVPEGTDVISGSKGSFIYDLANECILSENKLQESEELYKRLFDNAADIIAVIDPLGRFMDLSKRFEEETEYSRREMLGKNILTCGIVTTSSAAKIGFHLARVMVGEQAPIFEIDGVKRSGGIVNYELRAVPLQSLGKVVGIQAILRNITDRKRSEEALVRVKKQQEAILNNIPDLAWLKDKDSRFIAVNEPFSKASGVPVSDIVGKTDLDIWPRELALKYMGDDKEVICSREQRRMEEPFFDKRDGMRWIDTVKAPVFNDTGEVIGTTGIARDMTERKGIDEKLRQSEDKYRVIFENTGTATVIVDEHMTISMVNTEFSRFMGWTAKEVEGTKKLNEFIHELDMDKVKEFFWLRRVDPEAVPKDYEIRIVDRQRKVHEVVVRAALIPGTHEAVVAMQDITELKRNEYQLNRQKEMLDNANKALEHKLEELHEAVSHIKKLEGLVPICANCKKLKVGGKDPGDPNAWVTLEKYFTEKTDASFTHGLCPGCIKKLYGEHLTPKDGN